MNSVDVTHARSQFNKLLERVLQGETILITQQGVPIAKLVSADPTCELNPRQIANEIRKLRKGLTLQRNSIRALINEGRH